jgi:membrane fusion protein (multidrug efflux system)
VIGGSHPDDLRGNFDAETRRNRAPQRRRAPQHDYLLLPNDEQEERSEPYDVGRCDGEALPDPIAERKRKRRRLIIIGIVGALLLIAALGFGYYWWTTLRWFYSTDDAYTQADNSLIAPKVAGYVAKLLVTDNQHVKTGQTLVQIDPRDYQAALDQATADVASARANIANIDAQTVTQQATIDQARADITAAQAALVFSQQQNWRAQELVRSGTGTVQAAQQAASDLQSRQAALSHNQAVLKAATDNLEVLKTQRTQAEAAVQYNQAVLEQAKLNLGYTTIASPIDGAVGDRSVQLGAYVQPGQGLMTIVPLGQAIYVVANFKETQIEQMFRGEKVDLSIDTFPGVKFSGTVDSLAPGSGAQFALLPPENATGNFTKIVQRVPVKILIDNLPKDRLDQLRPGLSVEASVDSRTAPPEAQRQTPAPSAGVGPPEGQHQTPTTATPPEDQHPAPANPPTTRPNGGHQTRTPPAAAPPRAAVRH